MAEIVKNWHKPAPKWFRKTKQAVTLASDAAIAILIATGHTENSLAMLIVRIGVSYAIKIVEGILVDDDE